jgi:hypothetical protein
MVKGGARPLLRLGMARLNDPAPIDLGYWRLEMSTLDNNVEAIDILDNADYAKAADAAAELVLMVEKLDHELQSEVFARFAQMSGGMFGNLLMQVMGAHVLGDLHSIGLDNKTFWVECGGEMGPDWLHMLKHVAAFMSKVDEF